MTGERRGERCPQEELAVGWAMHSLEPDEEARVRDHLPGCAQCRETVRATEEVTAALGGSVRQYDPPTGLKSRLMAEVERTPQERVAPTRPAAPIPSESVPEPAPVRLDERRKNGIGRRLLAAAAVVVALAAVGVAGVRFNQLDDRISAEEQRNSRLNKALELAANPETNRAVLRSPSGDPVAIMLSSDAEAAVMEMKLAPNAADQTYVVWGKSTPEAVPLTMFTVQPDSTVQFVNWSNAAHQHQVFAISLEPGTTMPATPSDVVAFGQVGNA
ncbi:anti-sigma factor [Actinosynnema sp. NPDC023587]|uniref:anti-sigma factor n=1 Tax=Actinosynnema sp. NPDC023587 TaxID=3154695 RepID=UPI0033C06C9D